MDKDFEFWGNKYVTKNEHEFHSLLEQTPFEDTKGIVYQYFQPLQQVVAPSTKKYKLKKLPFLHPMNNIEKTLDTFLNLGFITLLPIYEWEDKKGNSTNMSYYVYHRTLGYLTDEFHALKKKMREFDHYGGRIECIIR